MELERGVTLLLHPAESQLSLNSGTHPISDLPTSRQSKMDRTATWADSTSGSRWLPGDESKVA